MFGPHFVEGFTAKFRCFIALTLASISASIPSSPLYQPVALLLLPALWPMWILVLRDFSAAGRSSGVPGGVVHVVFGAVLALHVWKGSYRGITALTGKHALFALVLLCSLASWFAWTYRGEGSHFETLPSDSEQEQAIHGAHVEGENDDATLVEVESEGSESEHRMETPLYTSLYHGSEASRGGTAQAVSSNELRMASEMYSSVTTAQRP